MVPEIQSFSDYQYHWVSSSTNNSCSNTEIDRRSNYILVTGWKDNKMTTCQVWSFAYSYRQFKLWGPLVYVNLAWNEIPFSSRFNSWTPFSMRHSWPPSSKAQGHYPVKLLYQGLFALATAEFSCAVWSASCWGSTISFLVDRPYQFWCLRGLSDTTPR